MNNSSIEYRAAFPAMKILLPSRRQYSVPPRLEA
jgi:hypothetical protein